MEMFDDSVISPAGAHGFANGVFLGHLWDALLWLSTSRETASLHQVARHVGAEDTWALETHGYSSGPDKVSCSMPPSGRIVQIAQILLLGLV